MPATERRFDEALPRQLYLDTDFLIAGIVRNEPHHDRVQQFLERLARHGVTELYVSSLAWLEFADTVMRDSFRNRLPEPLRRDFQLHAWETRAVRDAYIDRMNERLSDLLAPFEWGEIPMTPEIRSSAARLMAQYRMRSQDAAHLATALTAGVFDFASFDRIFRRVENLNLWNDRIYLQG